MLRDSNNRSWLLVVVFGTLIGMVAAELIVNFAGSNSVKDQWPSWQTGMLQFPLIVLSVGIGMGLYLKFSGLMNLTTERVLKLLKPGAKLEIVLRQDGWGVLLAQYLISIDGAAIVLTTFYRENLMSVTETLSWRYTDNTIRLTVKEHLTPTAYPDFFRKFAERIVIGVTEIKPQIRVAQAEKIFLTQR